MANNNDAKRRKMMFLHACLEAPYPEPEHALDRYAPQALALANRGLALVEAWETFERESLVGRLCPSYRYQDHPVYMSVEVSIVHAMFESIHAGASARCKAVAREPASSLE